MQPQGARVVFGLATVIALTGLAASPRPVAAWERTLTISFYSGGGYGDGAGRVTSDDGNIDCSWNAGVATGACSALLVLPNFLSTYDIVLTLTSAASSYSCLSNTSLCQPSGAVQTFPVHFAIGTPGGQTVTPSFNLKLVKVNVFINGAGSVQTNGDFCSGGYSGDVCGQYKWGQTATLTAVAGSAAFSWWAGGLCSGTNPVCSFTVNSSTPSAVAYFGYVRIRLEAGSGGRVCFVSGFCAIGDGTSTLNTPTGTVIRLRADPDSGHTFDHWSPGPCAGLGVDCTFPASTDATIKGFFASTAVTPAPTAKPAPKPTPKPTATPTAAPATGPSAVPRTMEPAAPSADLPTPSRSPSAPPSPGASVAESGGTPAPSAPGAPSAVPDGVADPRGGADSPNTWLILLLALGAALFSLAFMAGRRRNARPPRV